MVVLRIGVGRAGGQARLVVHAAPPARRPVAAVGPGAVGAQPLVVRAQDGKHARQPVAVAEVAEVLPLRPRQHVGSRRRRVEAREAIVAERAPDLAADEPVRVLLGVEVVERPDERKRARAVTPEQRHEARVPQEDAVVEGRVDEARHEAARRLRPPQVRERQLPRLEVAVDRRRRGRPRTAPATGAGPGRRWGAPPRRAPSPRTCCARPAGCARRCRRARGSTGRGGPARAAAAGSCRAGAPRRRPRRQGRDDRRGGRRGGTISMRRRVTMAALEGAT